MRIETILEYLSPARHAPLRLTGAVGETASCSATIIARGSALAKHPLVVLVADDEAMTALAAEIDAVGQALNGHAPSVHVYPAWERSPYEPVAPSIRCRLARAATLSAVQSLRDPGTSRLAAGGAVLITTWGAACQATAPPSEFRDASISLTEGANIGSRDLLIQRLVSAGYERVDPVQDQGTFAVRGEIVDVFPPLASRPLRIELFDDTVEKIREFDPETQRTTTAGEGARYLISPAREVLIHSGTVARLRERLKERADSAGVSRRLRDPLLESVTPGSYSVLSDAWASFAYETRSTLWDHLDPDWPVVWVDELTSNERWRDELEEHHALVASALESGRVLPNVDDIFLTPSRPIAPRLFLDRLDIHQAALSAAYDRASVTIESPPAQADDLRSRLREGYRGLAFATTQSQLERTHYLLEERQVPARFGGTPSPGSLVLHEGDVGAGFLWPEEGLFIITEDEFFGSKKPGEKRRARKPSRSKDWAGLQALGDLQVGDAVVHLDHGIGRYRGLVRLDLMGGASDFLQLEYAGQDKLYLPIYRLDVIQKYSGAGDSAELARLGGSQFAKAKEKVRTEVRRLAIDLVQLYAERKVRPGIRMGGRDRDFLEFEAKFPFEETPDQLKAIDDTLADLSSGRAMDRLVCGDVGYGKTEVALRAAFRAASDGRQVAVLVPTTLLAFQHEQSFRARMRDYPFTIASLSRFKSAKEQKATIDALAAGQVDIVIGTHRVLSKDVRFRDLALVIIDEEHRFGVEHKERLKALKVNAHVLTLTATPIPRTLHMALSGLRDISLINTPPVDRMPIRTYISQQDDDLIARAITDELARGGQVFFVHNRVQDIAQVAARVVELVPQARVSIGHGQLGEKELENAMMSFYEKRTNVLVCTSIIESGLDVPSANTLIVNRADTFGLAQLYQIRGRVGRGQNRAYAYLLVPPDAAIGEDAKKRLGVIQRFVELGSGFSVASHDLEIRGGGDLLGPQQSGHIAAVGFDLYLELLEEAVREIRGKPETVEEEHRSPQIKTPFPAFLPEDFVPDVHQRLALYRRFSAATREDDVIGLESEIRDRFGPLPEEAQGLLWLIRIKLLLKTWGIESLTAGAERVSLQPGASSPIEPARIIALIASRPADFQLLPDSRIVARAPTGSLRDLAFGLEKLLVLLAPKA